MLPKKKYGDVAPCFRFGEATLVLCVVHRPPFDFALSRQICTTPRFQRCQSGVSTFFLSGAESGALLKTSVRCFTCFCLSIRVLGEKRERGRSCQSSILASASATRSGFSLERIIAARFHTRVVAARIGWHICGTRRAIPLSPSRLAPRGRAGHLPI